MKTLHNVHSNNDFPPVKFDEGKDGQAWEPIDL